MNPCPLLLCVTTLYALARVERDIGAKKFISLLLFLLVFNSIVEVAVYKIFPNIPCSIGFSGVLFGIMTWELVTTKELDFILLTSIVSMVAVPSIQNNNVSLIGHSIGAISGIIGGLIWKKLI